jgi:HEPN domain-containing protein
MKEAKGEAIRWFLQGEDDLRFVEWVWKENKFFDKGCFMAQQAGEKFLKACLYARGERHVIGHSLFVMSQELSNSDRSFQDILNEAKELDRFYIPTRYPNGLPGGSPFQTYTAGDLTQAWEGLKRVFEVARIFLERQGIIGHNTEKNRSK